MIFIVNGAAGSGKTTFEQYMRCCMQSGTSYIISSIDCVKDVAHCAGWDGTKTSKNRKFLSDLKKLLTEWDDMPFQTVAKYIINIEQRIAEAGLDMRRIAIFVDVREPDEIARYVREFGAVTILVQRDTAEEIMPDNSSDSAIFEYKNYDITINNNGSKIDLLNTAEKLIEHFNLYKSQQIMEIDIEGNLK